MRTPRISGSTYFIGKLYIVRSVSFRDLTVLHAYHPANSTPTYVHNGGHLFSSIFRAPELLQRVKHAAFPNRHSADGTRLRGLRTIGLTAHGELLFLLIFSSDITREIFVVSVTQNGDVQRCKHMRFGSRVSEPWLAAGHGPSFSISSSALSVIGLRSAAYRMCAAGHTFSLVT